MFTKGVPLWHTKSAKQYASLTEVGVLMNCKMHEIGEQFFIDISLVFNGLDFQSGSELGTPYISVTFLRLARNTYEEKSCISLRML